MAYNEGQTAIGPNGERIVFRGGQWVSASQPMQGTGPDPFKVEDQQIQREAAARAARTAEQANANAAAARDLAERRFQFEKETKNQPTAIDPQKIANLRALESQLAEMEKQFDAGPGATSGLMGLADYNPWASANAQYDAAGAGLGDVGFAAFRVPGSGSQSDADLRKFMDANQPSASDLDASASQKMANVRNRLNQTLQAYGLNPAPLGEQTQPDQNTSIPGINTGGTLGGGPSGGVQRSTLVDIGGGGGQGGTTLATGNTRTEDDPTLKGVNDRVRQMIDKGATREQIMGYLQSVGAAGEGFQSVAPALDAATDWKRKHPNTPYTGKVNVDDRIIPMSFGRQVMNESAQGQYGGFSPGTYAINTADALTMGNLDSMTSNPEQTRAGMAGLSQIYPKSAATGQVSGATLGTLGVGRTLGAAGKLLGAGRASAALASPLAADIVYGAGYGAGNNDENRLAGAAMGAGIGFAGNKIGTGVASGIGRAISPSGGAMAPLYEAGVRPTIGQRLGEKGIIGKGVNAFEQALQSIPFAGSMVQGARQKARDQFERGAFNQALGDLGQALPADVPLGPEAQSFAKQAFDQSYDQIRGGMTFAPDPQFGSDLGAMQQRWASLGIAPETIKQATEVFKANVSSRLGARGGQLTGNDFIQAQSGLGKAAAHHGPTDPNLALTLRDLASLVDEGASRQSPADIVDQFRKTQKGFGKLATIQKAAEFRGNGPGRFGPNSFDRAVQKGDRSVRHNAYSRGEAAMQDYAQSGLGLVDTLPNSGSADRLLATQIGAGSLGGGAALGGLVSAATLGKAAAPTLLYAPGVRDVIANTMAPRSSKAMKLFGKKIKDNKALGGTALTPLMLQYLNQ